MKLLDKLLLLLPQVKFLFEQNKDLKDKYLKLETFHNQRVEQLESELVECRLQVESDKHSIRNLQEKLERKQEIINTPEYAIDMPQIEVDELKKALKLADSYTMETIVQYLNLDTYQIVKNLSKVTNSTNAPEIIAYRDGAISRNDALSQVLKESIKSKIYTDRIAGEVRTTSKK